MIYADICTGISAATVAWRPLGWRAAWYSEIEPFPCALLAHHYPRTPNFGDMRRFQEWPDAAIDFLVGGTPCQSFSVAGLRKGLADPRGNLMLTYLAIAERFAPRWLVWENVPGVLSSNDGRDFGTFLGGLAELGYGFAYRVLDAQFFGVAQRRRRVFVVGHLGDWRRAAAVLFERESLLGHPAPSRSAGQGVAATLTRGAESSGRGGYAGRRREDDVNLVVAPTLSARTRGGGGLGTDFECDGGLIPGVAPTLRAGGNRTGGDRPPGTDVDTADSLIPVVARALTTSNQRIDAESETLLVAHALRGEGFDASEDGTGHGTPIVPVTYAIQAGAIAFDCKAGGDTSFSIGPVAGTLRGEGHGGGHIAAVFGLQQITSAANRSRVDAGPAPTLARASRMHAFGSTGVRRLTPRECERLQGFPDDWTNIPYRGKAAADAPRYKSLGNSMAVPVMRWLGQRIQLVDTDLSLDQIQRSRSEAIEQQRAQESGVPLHALLERGKHAS